MPRAIWSGALSFGLVNIPVRLATAVAHKEVRFRMLHDADGGKVQLKRFCSIDGKEVPYEHVVKGYEVAKGQYVVVTPEELAAFDPKATRTVEIHDFVELSQIDPAYYETTYYLVPDKGAARPYALLREAMRASGKVAIASMVLRTREYLACVRPFGRSAIALSTMNRADEIVDEDQLDLPSGARPGERELRMAEQLVESLTTDFDPARYPDVRRERILALVEQKAEGRRIEAPAEERRPAEVVSLADALTASLAAARERGAAGRKDEAAHGDRRSARAAGERRHRTASAARTSGRKGHRAR